MTKEEYDKLESNIYLPHLIENSPPCPNCGQKTTHPTPGCYCRREAGKHIMEYHHTCEINPLTEK